jgi:hypothetical protein
MTIRQSVLLAATIAFFSMLAPAMSLDQHKAAHDCSAMVVDPSTAINLQRPSALRYKAAPLRICMRDDTHQSRSVAAG